MNNFHIGQHVVCINDTEGIFDTPGIEYDPGLDGLKKDVVYTIRDLQIDDIENYLILRLEEIFRPLNADGSEPGYCYKRFKPLQKIKVEDFMKQEVDA